MSECEGLNSSRAAVLRGLQRRGSRKQTAAIQQLLLHSRAVAIRAARTMHNGGHSSIEKEEIEGVGIEEDEDDRSATAQHAEHERVLLRR